MATNGATQSKAEGMQSYAAPSLFQPHLARKAIRDAHEKKIPPLIGYYAGISSVPVIRYLAPMGFDSVWIDWEHSSCNVETMTTMVHEAVFMSGGRTIPWVRVPGHDHAAIGFALDAGASLIIPQIETVEQAKHVLSAAKFGTKRNGTRSAPPFRFIPGLTDIPYDPTRDFHSCLNDQAAIMIQIESAKGVENLDAILTECPDIDAVWFGSLDCRVSMSLPHNLGLGGAEPEWLALNEKLEATLKKHNKPRGGFAFGSPPYGTEEGLKAAGEKYSFLIVTVDLLHLGMMGQDLVQARQLFHKPADVDAAQKKEAVAADRTAQNGVQKGS